VILILFATLFNNIPTIIVKIVGKFAHKMPQSDPSVFKEKSDFDFSDRFSEVVTEIQIGLWHWDAESDRLHLSAQYMKMLGYDAEPTLTERDFIRDRMHPQDRLKWQSEIIGLLDGSSNAYHRQVRVKHKLGYWLWLEDYGRTIRNTPHGKPAAVEGAVRNISQLKLRENKLRLQEEHFRQTFEFAPIGLALVGLKGEWLRVNRSLCKILGYSKEELYELTFQDITYEEDLDKDLTLFNEVMAHQRSGYQLEKRYYHKNGKIIWANLSVTLVQSDNGDPLHFISQIQDITQTYELNEKTKKQNERLFNFAYIVSHNLRSHSSNILAMLDLFRLKKPEVTNSPIVESLNAAAANLHETIEDLYRSS